MSKALVVHARTLEIYDQVDLAQTAIADGEIAQKLTLMHDGKIGAHLDFSDFGGRLSPFPFALVFEQSKNEELLYQHLQHNGKDVQWLTELESLSQTADGVKAEIETASGETQTLAASYLVGCDGASSPTRHLLQLGFEGSTYPRLFYVADVEMEFPADKATLYPVLGQDALVLKGAAGDALLESYNGEHGHQDLQPELEHEHGDLIDFNVMPLDPRVVEIFGTNQPFQVLL